MVIDHQHQHQQLFSIMEHQLLTQRLTFRSNIHSTVDKVHVTPTGVHTQLAS